MDLVKSGSHKTCLEKQMHGYLTVLGFEQNVDYYEQYSYGHYVLDFAFIQSRRPFHGLDIETDGVMFHSSTDQRKRDGYRTYKLMKGGWLVERFGETFSIEDVAAVLEKHGIEPS
jgi:very-short-patch-repair endonuclease